MKYMSHALTRGDFMYYGSFFVSKTCIFECNTTSDWLNRMVVLPVHSNTAKCRQILENKTKNICENGWLQADPWSIFFTDASSPIFTGYGSYSEHFQ